MKNSWSRVGASIAAVTLLAYGLVGIETPAHAATADAGYGWTATWDDQPILVNPVTGCGVFGAQVNVGNSANPDLVLATVDFVSDRSGVAGADGLLYMGDDKDLTTTFVVCPDDLPGTIRVDVSYYAPTSEGFGYDFEQEYIQFEENYPFAPNLQRQELPKVMVQSEYPNTIYLPYSCNLIYFKRGRSPYGCEEDDFSPVLINKAKPRKIIPTSYDESRETPLSVDAEYWMRLDKGNLKPGTYFVLRSTIPEASRWKCSLYYEEVCRWSEGESASVGGLAFQWNGSQVTKIKTLSNKKAKKLLGRAAG